MTTSVGDRPYRLLLVDDNPDDRRLVVRALARDFPSLTVVEVVDAEALEGALSDAPFDLVITDYALRWSDGLAVLRAVRSVQPDCPVIMYTGTGSQEIAVEAMKAGLTDYVVKSPRHYAQLPGVARAAFKQADHRATVRRLEEELQQAQKMEALGQLAGGIAHDFNNLLTIIGGHAQLLELELDADDPRQDDAVAIREATARASAITRQLLAFGRRQPLRPEQLDLADAVTGSAALLQRLIGPSVQIDVEHDRPAPHAIIDRGQLEQVLMNLALNARDAMPDGGRLTFRIAREGNEAILRAADTGHGMSEEVLARAFEPFYTTKGAGHGTGLGLPTVRRIVEGAGGSVTVESTVGEGTRFEIRLPAEGPAGRPSGSPEVTIEQVGGSGPEAGEDDDGGVPGARSEPPVATILVVDDERAVLGLAERILRRAGYRVIAVGSGTEALEEITRPGSDIDLLLTDLVMPEPAGPELAIAARRAAPGIAVLFMSGYVSGDVLEALDAPVVPKPFRPEALLDVVRRALTARLAGSGGEGAPSARAADPQRGDTPRAGGGPEDRARPRATD